MWSGHIYVPFLDLYPPSRTNPPSTSNGVSNGDLYLSVGLSAAVPQPSTGPSPRRALLAAKPTQCWGRDAKEWDTESTGPSLFQMLERLHLKKHGDPALLECNSTTRDQL